MSRDDYVFEPKNGMDGETFKFSSLVPGSSPLPVFDHL